MKTSTFLILANILLVLVYLNREIVVQTLLYMVAYSWSYATLPRRNGVVYLTTNTTLQNGARIVRESNGAAHVYASSLHDAAFAQGYLLATERLLQLEITRRAALGRLSEVIAPMLYADRMSRTFGFARLGVSDIAKANKTSQGRQHLALTQAYVDGINTFINSAEFKTPFEFTALGLKPTPFTVEHVAAIARISAWQMARGWFYKITNLHLANALSKLKRDDIVQEAVYNTLFDLYNYPEDAIPSHLPTGDIEINIQQLEKMVEVSPPSDQGSNSWAISGKYTKSGKPLFSSDPHLAVNHPSVWFQIHIDVPGAFNFTGFNMVGLPFIQIGHNEKIAYGVTLSYADSADVYVENTNEDVSKYEFKGEWRDVRVVEEAIHVKGSDKPHIERVKYTNHGPILSDIAKINPAFEKLDVRKVFSIRAAFLEPNSDTLQLMGFLKLTQANNWDQFYAASKEIEILSLNLVYADVEGNIGYSMVGQIPDRSKFIDTLKPFERGMPLNGWTGEHEWNGYIPTSENPALLNPKQGFIISANHKIYGANYKHYLGSAFMYGSRASRLKTLMEQFIEEKGYVTLENCRAMQMDITEPSIQTKVITDVAQSMLDYNFEEDILSKIKNPNNISLLHVMESFKVLAQFNGTMLANSVGAALHQVFSDMLFEELVRSLIGVQDESALILLLRGAGLDKKVHRVGEYTSHDVRLIERMRSSSLAQSLEKGHLQYITYQAMIDTIDRIRHLTHIESMPLPSDINSIRHEIATYQYGKFHVLKFNHAFGEKIHGYNRGPYPIGGSAHTPNLMSPAVDSKIYQVLGYPSFRMILDMSDLEECYSIFAPGNSGHLASTNFDDNIQDYINGVYRVMPFSKTRVEQSAVSVLDLRPENNNQ